MAATMPPLARLTSLTRAKSALVTAHRPVPSLPVCAPLVANGIIEQHPPSQVQNATQRDRQQEEGAPHRKHRRYCVEVHIVCCSWSCSLHLPSPSPPDHHRLSLLHSNLKHKDCTLSCAVAQLLFNLCTYALPSHHHATLLQVRSCVRDINRKRCWRRDRLTADAGGRRAIHGAR